MKSILFALAALLLAAALASAQPLPPARTDSIPTISSDTMLDHAVAVLMPTAGNTARGTITFDRAGEGVHIVAHLMGLAPGEHGLHIHQYGDCSAPDATSAGDHFAMPNQAHGAPTDKMRHAGDLGNITVAADSTATLEMTDTMVALSGANSVIGRAVVVHARPDDLKTPPGGNSGPRIACGVIGLASGN